MRLDQRLHFGDRLGEQPGCDIMHLRAVLRAPLPFEPACGGPDGERIEILEGRADLDADQVVADAAW